MFGEESIYGQSIIHIDDKNRAFIPKFTGVEKDDNLLILNKGEHIDIYSVEAFEESLKQLEKSFFGNDLQMKQQLDLEILKLYSSILRKVKVDSQARINFGNVELEDKEILCIGAKDHIMLKTKFKGIKKGK